MMIFMFFFPGNYTNVVSSDLSKRITQKDKMGMYFMLINNWVSALCRM